MVDDRWNFEVLPFLTTNYQLLTTKNGVRNG